jgi:Fe-S cluster assembly iron-binding protein IscA
VFTGGHITANPSTTTQNICINGTSTALSVTTSGSSPSYQWYSNTSNSNSGGTIISGATSDNYTPPTTVAGTTYYYCSVTATVGGNSINQISNVSGAININLPPVAGTISGGNSVTAGTNSTVLTIAGNTGSVQWQNSSDNVTFNDIGSATNSTHTATNLNTTTYYRAKVTSAGCSGTEYTNTNTVVVNPAPSGTTSPSITISGATLNVTNNTATAVDPNLTMSFSGDLTGFTVTISENYSNGDVLSYTGTLPSGVTTSGFSTQRRSITFTGTTSAANWQTFLRTVTIQTTSATCNPETRKVSFTASTNFYNYFNGHYYEYVSSNKNWTQARDYAASKSFYGRQGYLVVITSAEENAYISQMIGYNTWMGGTDNYKLINAAVGYTKYANQSAAEGKYHWVTGPEKGVNFSNGNHSPSIPAGRYCRWQSGEPNNYNTGFYDNNVGAYGEHYMHIYADRKTWNDFPNDRYFASIIEYGDMPGDNPQGTVEGTRNISVSVPATGSVTGGGGTVCSGTNSTTLTLSGNAGGSTVARWESSPDNFLETSTSISNTSTSYTATNLTQTTFFRAVVVNGSCSTVTTPVKITVVELNAGDVIATTNQVCAGQSVKLTLSGLVGTVQKWQTTTNTSGGSFTDISNTTTSLTRTVSTAGNHYFRAVVNTAACTTSDVYSDWYTVVATVGATPTGGEVTSQSHCSVNNSGTLNLSGATGGTFTWQYSTNNGTTWTNIAITAESYNYANIAQNTLFRVQVSNGCNTAYSSNGSVTIYGTNKCQWIGGTSTDWGTKANWCNDAIAENGSDFDISPDATYNLVLDRNRTVGTINFNGAAKYIYLGNHKLTVTDILDADTVNHIKTNGNGELKTSIPNNDSFVFCVGAGSYNPVTITNKTGSTDDFQVRLIDNVYDRGSTGNPLNTPRIKRTWFIDKIGGPANSGSGIDMAFDWYTPEVSGTINTYRLYHYNGNNWDKLSAGSYATRTRNLKYSGYTGTFSPFSMGDDVVLLPVNWVGLSCVREEGRRNRILWVTGSETLSDSFVVERGNTAGQFRRVGAIPAAVNSTTPRQYSMIDEQAPEGPSFYRVRQTDKLGNSSCSEICEVASASSEEGNVKIFPNPADNNLYVQFAEAQEPGTEVVVTDITGKEVLRRTVNKGRMVLPTGQLPSGVYAVQIKRGGNADIMQKIIIQH